jgi:uncharacterized protein (DUF1684 family)
MGLYREVFMGLSEFEELADYRRAVAGLYARARSADVEAEARWRRFCRERDDLFAAHPQSALAPEQKAVFKGLRYYPYQPALRFRLAVDTGVEHAVAEYELPADGLVRLERFGRIQFEVEGQPVSLSLFWIKGYGGGIFLPFRDLTNREDTYGGGRYLLDTIKHADLGREDGRLVVDFNYAYNPSCAYNPRWVCPLAPPENWLKVPIRAGELRFPDE